MKKIVILGGGPIGIECAVLAVQQGHDVTVYEKGEVGASMSRWGHVELFSNWKLNVSSWGAEAIGFIPNDDYPTAAEFLTTYLRPLAESLGETIRLHTEVLGVTRSGAIKSKNIGSRSEAGVFRIVLRNNGEEFVDYADILIDASGVLECPADMGIGGLPVLNEEKFATKIERYEVDSQRQRERYSGKRMLVVGDGFSAVTSVVELLKLKKEVPSTQIWWLVLSDEPYSVIDDDTLPARKAISILGNQLISGEKEGVRSFVGFGVQRFQNADDDAILVTLENDDETVDFVVDEVVSNVGYRPDLKVLRELQVHLCYATEGPMKLAATLLSQDGNSDCLAQVSPGVDTLRNPENDLFILGAKSYGRNSNFLLRLGFEQIESVLDTLK